MPSDYPPAQQAWRFPPPAVSRRWRWAALLAPLVAIAVITTVLYTTYRWNDVDARGFIDDPDVSSTVSSACAVMTTTVEGLRVEGPSARQARVLTDQNAAVMTMVRQVERLPDGERAADRPLDDWLQDWQRFVHAREQFAQQIRSGADATLRVPHDASGRPIVERMNAAANGSCLVPEALLDPFALDDVEV